MALGASLLEETVVEVNDLTVRYGDTAALAGVSLSVERGRVLAVVGANGAGKSTLFRALLGLVPVDEGEVRLLGRPVRDLGVADRARIAFVSERHAELAHASVAELIRMRASFYPRFDPAPLRELLAELGVREGKRAGELSRGQRAVLCVGLALAQQPEVLLLDDPTLGLDPLARRRVMQSLVATGQQGSVTVLFASHELSDVERIADDVLLLAHGRGSVAVELESFVAEACVTGVPDDVSRRALSEVEGVLHVWRRRDGLEVVIRGDALDRLRTLDEIGVLAGADPTPPRAASFEELALAWLASGRGAS